jgi:hypothetical protein
MPSRKASAAVVDREGLADLEVSDEFEPIQPLRAGLVAMDLGQSCVHRGIDGDDPVNVSVPEEPSDPVHHRDD